MNSAPCPGLVYNWTPNHNVYTNISTSFETPTTAEFANPSGVGGLNPLLEPQTATNYEVGLRGAVSDGYTYNLALFRIDIEDELIPFEVEGQPGRNFFANAGESRRNGVEFALSAPITSRIDAFLSYTYSDFTFVDFSDDNGNVFDGNRLPGIPQNVAQSEFSYQLGGFSETGISFMLMSFLSTTPIAKVTTPILSPI